MLIINFKELNDEGNPDRLLKIATQGIFLHEPLYRYMV